MILVKSLMDCTAQGMLLLLWYRQYYHNGDPTGQQHQSLGVTRLSRLLRRPRSITTDYSLHWSGRDSQKFLQNRSKDLHESTSRVTPSGSRAPIIGSYPSGQDTTETWVYNNWLILALVWPGLIVILTKRIERLGLARVHCQPGSHWVGPGTQEPALIVHGRNLPRAFRPHRSEQGQRRPQHQVEDSKVGGSTF